MKLRKNDKVITAFLVSLGLFTISQAKNYVVNLSKKDKTLIASLSNLNNIKISNTQGNTYSLAVTEDTGTKKKTC
ncbi:MAG TPA: hypothetical protein PK103_05865 [Elusimicrobiales bacterium]|nr:hypothetical protein [Elusimicrobiales bacterium]HOL62874.1 hypothetical protein [Elusimicrobiales bacterium]HPO94952.1 hypothetical protein [Elusimicrobiales bacterium]